MAKIRSNFNLHDWGPTAYGERYCLRCGLRRTGKGSEDLSADKEDRGTMTEFIYVRPAAKGPEISMDECPPRCA